MKSNLLTSIKRTTKMAGLKIKKYSPQIMVVTGCVGAVGAAVLACKETLRLEETLDECKNELSAVKALDGKVSEKEYKKELTSQTVKNAVIIGKLYAPSVTLGVTSVGLILGANGIMQKRNASLAAAYATVDSMYKRYRKNVVDTFGSEVDQDMRFGVKREKIQTEVTDEKGKTKKVDKVIDVVDDSNLYGDYARFFDSSCMEWSDNPEYNMMFLKSVQSHCNNLLIANGYLFLNDVYKALGMQPSIAGQSVGWIYDENNPVGDNYVDFGLFDKTNAATRRFVNNMENVVLLDFNVDGDILNNPMLKLWK